MRSARLTAGGALVALAALPLLLAPSGAGVSVSGSGLSSDDVLVSSSPTEDVYARTGVTADGVEYVTQTYLAKIAPAGASAAVPSVAQIEEKDYAFLRFDIPGATSDTNFGYYDNCPGSALTLYLNKATAPDANAIKEVKNAVAQLSAQTGIAVNIVDTKVIPYTTEKWEAPYIDYYERAVYFAFAPGSLVKDLADPLTVGIAGPVGLRPNDRRPYEFTQSAVVIDTDIPLKKRARTILHEMGHAFGLGHAPSDTTEVMYYMINDKPPTLMPGDVTGLDVLYNQLPNFRC